MLLDIFYENFDDDGNCNASYCELAGVYVFDFFVFFSCNYASIVI